MNQTNVRAQIEQLKARRKILTEQWSRLTNGIPDSLDYDTRSPDHKTDMPITPARIEAARAALEAVENQLEILTQGVAVELLQQAQTEAADEATENAKRNALK